MPDPKQAAAERAVGFVRDGMVVGLGTGSTVSFALRRLGARIREEGLHVRGVPTSKRTEAEARAEGIPLVTFEDVPACDLTIDGADEVDPAWNLIKGGGGALLREKIVAAASRCVTIAVGPGKRVERLGKFLLPVEVIPFGWRPAARALEALGVAPHLRRTEDESTYGTDEGNYILDCRVGAIEDPAALEAAIDRIPGVVETGLFVGLVHRLVEGREDGTCAVEERPPKR